MTARWDKRRNLCGPLAKVPVWESGNPVSNPSSIAEMLRESLPLSLFELQALPSWGVSYWCLHNRAPISVINNNGVWAAEILGRRKDKTLIEMALPMNTLSYQHWREFRLPPRIIQDCDTMHTKGICKDRTSTLLARWLMGVRYKQLHLTGWGSDLLWQEVERKLGWK